MNRSAQTTRHGFTLIEMLIVVSITAIVLALSFPMIGAMKRDAGASNGVNTITIAIPSVRRYATANTGETTDLVPDNVAVPSSVGVQSGIRSGAAAIFTPAGEIRLTRNNPGAKSFAFIPSDPPLLERRGPGVNDVQALGLPKRELNGFTDLAIDYLQLPSDTAVVGINRVSGGSIPSANTNSSPLLFPPPFAVWYSQNGYLIASGWDHISSPQRANDYQFVYYDGDYDGDYRVLGTGSARSTIVDYNPETFNPDSGDFVKANWDINTEKYRLPFDKLEAVIGVFAYSRNAFEIANERWEDGETTNIAPAWVDPSTGSANDTQADNEARWAWMKENGEMIMFSKQSGAIMRNRNE